MTVSIPSIGVRATVISSGLNASGGIAVPPLSHPYLASWYERGPAPGQAGPAVLLGHVDSAATGPAVFYELGDLRPGDLVYVTRVDHRTAIFRVTSVAMYPESGFPLARVFGYTPRPSLRLITCGGDFDARTHLYLDRIIAFASYVGRG
jgi:sortase (surface protein transpeptidase)